METYNTYIHNIDPFLIQFSEGFGIRWYGLAYLAGILLGYFIILKLIRMGKMQIPEALLSDFATWMAFGILIGGRLGYCLFYAPHLFFEFGGGFPFWGVLEVHKGGMASHGGIAGVSLACYLFAKKHKLNFLHCLDITVLGGSLGFLFGRIANFINGELYGREVASKISWAVKFPSELHEWASYEPSKLNRLGSLVESLKEIPVIQAGRASSLQASASQWSAWVSQYKTNGNANWSVNQFMDYIQNQVYAGNEMVVSGLQWVLTARHPSQLYQSFLEGFLVPVLLNVIWLKPRHPGVIAAAFGALYALARIIGEQYRMPDAGIGYQLLGLTRGQWLSVAMLAAAFFLYIYSIKKNGKKYGGWL
jgi:phosphatidylglycerol---prolipoprotein diacylglyceryl transferase